MSGICSNHAPFATQASTKNPLQSAETKENCIIVTARLNKDLQINARANADLPVMDDPTLPRADAVAGLAQGAVTDAAETTIIELPRIARALRNRDFRLFWAGNF